MKKVEGVSISGYLYFIDLDAFELLSTYLKSFEKKCGSGIDELSEDIESRISEIFNEKIDSQNKVIDIDAVKSVISQIGTASSIETDISDSNNGWNNRKKQSERRAYSEFDKAVQGGFSIAKTVLDRTTNVMQELSQKIENNRK